MRAFTVSVTPKYVGGVPRWILVQVYKDHEEFLRHTGYADLPDSESVVACTYAEYWKRKKHRKLTLNPFATVSFYEGGVSTEAIAHEMVHAALVLYRITYDACVRLGKYPGDKEEFVAYVVGDLTAKVSRELIDLHIQGSPINSP